MQEVLANVVTVENGHPVTTSLKVAEVFGKQHAHVLRAIRELEVPDDFRASNFGLAEFADAQGKKRPMFHITRDGFTLLAMGFTGKEAMQFKIAYIEAFNAMEREISASRRERRIGTRTRMSRRAQMCASIADMNSRVRALEQILIGKIHPCAVSGLSCPSCVTEVENFCAAENLSFVNPLRFFSYYEERRWMIDGFPIENWRTVCRSWNFNNSRRAALPSVRNNFSIGEE